MDDAVRALVASGPTTEPVPAVVAWTAGLLAILIPLTLWRYRQVA